jgi:puromycin-sensitive aminopeptidase
MTTANPYRLSGNVLPTKYNLTITPNLTDFTFSGNEIIDILTTEPTDRVSINSIDLEIADASVTMENGTSLIAQNIELDEKMETATFIFGQSIPAGTAALNINFIGTLNDQLRGFYRSQYTTTDGQEQYLATTQFEATDARRAFPCWDDPAVKAIFQVTLVIPSNLIAISNTMIESETPREDNTKAVKFEDTPKMSTYLLAFLVGDFASVEQMAPNGTLVRVWATKGKEKQGQFAVENAVGLLTYLNDYFGIPYPLKKLDHIAVPDFAAGAMENWGAITYRETALLYDPENSSANTKQRIMEVVSHEMAHMWFGDLVTMEWWNDLWLNESFASWMGDKAVDHQYPEWNMWTQFVFQDTNSGLSLDGLRNSHPIEAKVEDPAQIRELFDAISYSKGGAVLRMLENFLGEEAFQQGLHGYLSAHQYGNARTEDLWSALEESSGQPVTTIMDSWVKQMGYPFLQVKAEQHDSGLSIGLSQHRFLYDNLMEQNTDDKTLWQVPVSIAQSGNDNNVSVLMDKQEVEVLLGKGTAREPNDWVKVNTGQTGFYRVNYQAEDWERLRRAVEKRQLPAIDRLGVQNDAYALVKAGHLPATQFLSLAESYKGETDASVWSDLATNLRGMENLLQDQPFFPQFRSFAGTLFKQIVGQVGWDARPNEGHLDSILRTVVLGQIGSYGDTDVLTEARNRFTRFLDEPSSLHPDLRGVVYGLTAQEGDKSTYDILWQLEKKAELHEESMRLLGALTRFQQKELLQDALERSITSEVRSQDSVLVMMSVAGNKHGKEMAWEFIKANWDELDRRYGRGGFAIMRLVSMTGAFTTLEKAQEVESFFEEHPAPSAQRTIQQSLERIRLNAKWLENNRQGLTDWFANMDV